MSDKKRGKRSIKKPLAPDPFDGAESLEEYGEGSLECCTVCGPMRCGYSGENLCGHLRWCDGDLCGPGVDEIGTYDDVPDGFKRVVRLIGCARSLRKQLRQHGRAERFISLPLIGCEWIDLKIAGSDFSQAANRLHDLDDETGIREGCAWLLGLDAKTKRANKLALAWLDREVAEQNERRSSGRQEYRVVVGRYGTKTLARNVSWSEAIRVSAEYKASMQYPDRVRIIHRKHRVASTEAA